MSSGEFIVERNVECVVCPGCAFTFDRYHIDTDGDGYSCPVCGTVGHLGIVEVSRRHDGVPARSVAGYPGIDWQADYYSADEGEYVCEDHGMPECDQGRCADLVWPSDKAARSRPAVGPVDLQPGVTMWVATEAGKTA